MPAPTYVCPSRRGATVGPYGDPTIWNIDVTLVPLLGSRSDYAGNGGTDTSGCCNAESGSEGNGGPPSGSDSLNFDAAGYFRGKTYWKSSTGTIYGGSQVSIKQIPDGLSKTYLLGEKALQPQYYDPAAFPSSQRDVGDDQSMYQGYDYDTVRWAGNYTAVPTLAIGASWQPLHDENHFQSGGGPDGGFETRNFGSPHSSGCFFAMCDGSVQSISFTIDPAVHFKLANRKDGFQVDIP
jgi:hypothetical protein